MKTTWFALIACLVLSLGVASEAVWSQESEHAGAVLDLGNRHSVGWQTALKLKGPPVPPKFPQLGKDVERVVLDNGMVVYIQEDHRLPLIDALVLVRTGKYYETPAELGTADMVGELLRTGGTKNLSPAKLEERLDFIAAELSTGMENEECRMALNVPSKDADEGLSILADVMRNPEFDESRLELAKKQAIFALRSSNDTPAPLIRREFARLLYTSAHPAGRTPTIERIQQISRDELIRFHQKYFHPNEVMIGLTGDFNKAEMIAKVKKLWGDWPKTEVNLPELPRVNPQPKPGIYYVQKPVTQSSIRIGHWGTNRSNPDRFAIELMNDILGGSDFSSRITLRVRGDEGLAYSAASAFPTEQRDTSFFIAVAETKTDTTAQAAESLVDEVRKMTVSKITPNELQTAKEMFLYSYVFRYSEPSRVLVALMQLEYDKLPADYFEKEFAGYQAVTAEDIERAAKKYLHPDQLTIFIVGDYPKFAAALAKDFPQLGLAHQIQPLDFSAAARPPAAKGDKSEAK